MPAGGAEHAECGGVGGGRPARGSGRDAAKLAGFTAFAASMRLDAKPAAPHHTIDNRLAAGAALEAQVSSLLRRLADG